MENATSTTVREQWDRLRLSYNEATEAAADALEVCNNNPNDADAIARLKAAARIEAKALTAVMEADAPSLFAAMWKLAQLRDGDNRFSDRIVAELKRLHAVNDDSAIFDAFHRRAAAFVTLAGLPDTDTTGGSTPEQAAQWSIIDVAEAEICTSVATTARGAELQLWTAATYQFETAEEEAPCYRADLAYFTAQGDRRDWKDQLLIAAIRSLRAIGGAA